MAKLAEEMLETLLKEGGHTFVDHIAMPMEALDKIIDELERINEILGDTCGLYMEDCKALDTIFNKSLPAVLRKIRKLAKPGKL